MNGKLIIFSAPSGSGKTTIVRELLKHYPQFEFSISATSRAPRGVEQNGVDYYFLSQIFTMLIMYAIRRSVNEEKVRAKLLAHAAKPRKKSKFQERYEEALRQQQEQLNREQRRQRR